MTFERDHQQSKRTENRFDIAGARVSKREPGRIARRVVRFA